MAWTYPPPPATVSGDYITISRFLNSPTLLQRRLRDLTENRFIADVLLTGRYDAAGGALAYEQGESIYANDDPRAVAPGAEYPIGDTGTGTLALARTVKWGQDAKITDEAVSRMGMNPVNRKLIKLANTMVRYIDTVALGAIASAVTASSAAIAAWDDNAGAARILRDLLLGVANMRALNEGFEADTLVVDDLMWAYVLSDDKILAALRREAPGGVVERGTNAVVQIGALRVLPTPNLPVDGSALLLDSTQLGGMADEDLAGPGYTGAARGVQVKTMRSSGSEDDLVDQWRIRCRRVTVPVINEPSAGRLITGTRTV